MAMPLRQASEASGGVTMRDNLGNAVLDARAKKADALLPPGAGAITSKTRIVIFGCDVGRDTAFLTLLGELFGTPASVAAPIRAGVFRLADGVVQHRLARTWSVLWGKTSIVSTAASGWPAVRDEFTKKTDAKFTIDTATGSVIRSGVANATLDATKTEFFFAGVFSVLKTAVSTYLPVESAVIRSSDDDDTTQPMVVTAADVTADNADVSDPQWATVNITTLASVVDEEVSVADTRQYQSVSFGIQETPAKGPDPAETADGAPPPPAADPDAAGPSAFETFSAEYIAAGGTQAEFDEFVADLSLPAAEEFAAGESDEDLPMSDTPWEPYVTSDEGEWPA